MNFVKRAGISLGARRSRTAVLLGIFAVICTLLLGGFLLQAATARQEADAQREIGVDVTVRAEELTAAQVDRLGGTGPVLRYNPLVPAAARAHGFAPLRSEVPRPGRQKRGGGAEDGPGLDVRGVRDSELLLPFSYGSQRITAGRGIRPGDAGREVAVVERRLAERNGLGVGDTVRVGPADGGRPLTLTVVGVFRDPAHDPSRWVPSRELPGNTLYVPVGTARELGADEVDEAVFRIGSPEQAAELHARAERIISASAFDFRVNDRAYRDQVRPIRRVGAFAGLIVWVVAAAGAVILGLIVMLQIRERRAELGVLLALGEKKWKLVGQHTVEVAAVALPAVALAALAGQAGAQQAGDAVLDRGRERPT
ncbi:ABC transporter permease, partial [Streptomyces triticagri]